MEERFVQQAIAQLIQAQAQALATLTVAICEQLDPQRLHTDLKVFIELQKQQAGWSQITEKLLTESLAATEGAAIAKRRATNA